MRARLVSAVVAILCLVGVTAAVLRSVDTLWIVWNGAEGRMGPVTRAHGEMVAGLAGLSPGTPEYRQNEAQIDALTRKYGEHPWITLLHMVPGVVILTFAPLQFLPRVRRHRAFHRWNGRVLLGMMLLAGASGYFFGIGMPYGGWIEASAVAIFGTFFIYAGARGWLAIRSGRTALHREWMIRMFAAALAIAVMRIAGSVALVLLDGAPMMATPAAAGLALWSGWLVTLSAAELYIRASRRDARSGALSPDAAPAA